MKKCSKTHRLQLPEGLADIHLDITAADQSFIFYVGVDQMSGLETVVTFTPDVSGFCFPDVDFSIYETPHMPRGSQPKIETGIQGARKKHFKGEFNLIELIQNRTTRHLGTATIIESRTRLLASTTAAARETVSTAAATLKTAPRISRPKTSQPNTSKSATSPMKTTCQNLLSRSNAQRSLD